MVRDLRRVFWEVCVCYAFALIIEMIGALMAIEIWRSKSAMAFVLRCATKAAQEVLCFASHSPRNQKLLGNRSA
jgi:hypothetical protein